MATAPGVNYPIMAANFARQAGINPTLFQNQIRQESGFNPNATSRAGAQGIAQIMPQYHPGVNPHDPTASLKWAAGYMAGLVHKYGSYEKALSVYNSGRPDAYLNPNFAGGETYRYVRSIMGDGRSPGATPGGGPALPAAATAPQAHPFLDPGVLQTLLQTVGLPSVPTFGGTNQGPPPSGFPMPHGATNLGPPTSPPVPPMPAWAAPRGSTIDYLERFAKPYGVSVTSTTEGHHAPGSYHYQGRAVDFGGQNYQHLAALANAAVQHPQDFREMFYTGPGHPAYFIKNGKLVPLSKLDKGLYAEHENHVHLAA